LVGEYERIFSDLFHKRGALYRKIVSHLAEGICDKAEIQKALGMKKGGRVSEYFNDLQSAGFISQDHTWDIKTGKIAKSRKYRLKDNYLRFYLKYIAPNLPKIEKDRYQENAAQWSTIFGLQFENLVLNNRGRILELLHIDPHHVIWDNPYFQTRTKQRPGCQIDYLIQTRDRTLYLCEVKFSLHPVQGIVMEQVKKKMEALIIPKGVSVRPILIHVNGVGEQILASEFFSKIIDFGELLQSPGFSY
jgi:uncharacterized protein